MNRELETGHWQLVSGIALGLWILAGLAFLAEAVLPGSVATRTVGAVLLAAAVLATALALPPTDAARKHLVFARGKHQVFARLGAAALAFLIALTVVREGDTRSWLFVSVVALLAVLLAYHLLRTSR